MKTITINVVALMFRSAQIWADDAYLPKETLFKANDTYSILKAPSVLEVADINGGNGEFIQNNKGYLIGSDSLGSI